MDDFIIQYRGFSPSSFVQSYIRDVMGRVHEEAPSASTLRVSISKVGEQDFKGFVRVSSHAGQFFATGTDSRLPELADQLRDRIHRQLDKWKTKRFSHKSIRRGLRGDYEPQAHAN